MTGVVCCDLDGVVWRGDRPVPGAADGIARLREAGVPVVFLTNNSSGRRADYVARLGAAGVEAATDDVVTSAASAAAHLAAPGRLPARARVLACAGPGVVEALEEHGFVVVREAPADAVVVGWHREFDFERLRRAADAVRVGARFVATNSDPTYPSRDGLLPGNGALVAAVATASGVAPEVTGKPEAPMASHVREVLAARGLPGKGVVVGDRPSTDGAMAARLGWPFGLVLSGVAGPDGEEPVPEPPPPFLAADLGALAPALVEALASG